MTVRVHPNRLFQIAAREQVNIVLVTLEADKTVSHTKSMSKEQVLHLTNETK